MYQVFYTNLFVKCLFSGKINVMDSDNEDVLDVGGE